MSGAIKYPRARSILRHSSGVSAAKLLVATARQTRPWFDGIARALLGMTARDGKIFYRYTRFGKARKAFLRPSHLDSDLQSALELAVGDCYRLAQLPEPDLIIDGGANTGMFSLAATARWPSANVIAIEPVPDNIQTVHQHLMMNGVQDRVEVVEGGLAGEVGSLDFYVREANQGSFDGRLKYDSVIQVTLHPLRDLLAGRTFNSILIKLDIEGAERGVLDAFFREGCPEKTIIVMELHEIQFNRPFVEDLAAKHGLRLEFFELGAFTGHCQLTSANWVPVDIAA